MRNSPAPGSIWVVLPTYNGSAHLQEQLESIARQDRVPDGLVASDDGSEDNSVAILEDFARSVDFPVTILRQPVNVGLLTNLEKALSVALESADIIAFADQDDVWEPGKLTAVSQAFIDPATLLWFSDATFIDDDGAPYGSRLWEAITLSPGTDLNEHQHLLRFIVGATITGTAMAARNTLITASLPFPRTTETQGYHHFLHDGWLGLLAHLQGGVALEPTPLTRYRQHDQQFTGMSLLAAARSERGTRRRSLSIESIIEEELRLRSIVDHLERPQSLSFLGGALPAAISQRMAYATTRARVVTGGLFPTHLLQHKQDYEAHADGWRTMAADTVRFTRHVVARRRRRSSISG